MLNHSVVSTTLRPHGLQPARLLCPWVFSRQNTGVGCHVHSSRISSQPGDQTQVSHITDSLPSDSPEKSLLKYSWFIKLLISGVQQNDSFIHACTFFFTLFSILVYGQILNIVPCAIQNDLLVYPFYIQ